MQIRFENATERSAPLQIRRLPSDAGLIAGHASIFGLVDHFNERVEVGAFSKSIAEWAAKNRVPPLLWSHDPAEPIGSILSLREDNIGLHFEAQINLQTSRGREAFEHIKAGDVSGVSIGFRTLKTKSNNDGSLSLLEINLMEISIVALPANDAARITAIKSLDNSIQLERALREGIPLQLPRGAAAKIAKAGWDALHQRPFNYDWLAHRLDQSLRIARKGK
jgi:HK97 family phage prohead protease